MGAVLRAFAVFLVGAVVIVVAIGGVARPAMWLVPQGFTGWVLAQFGDASCGPVQTDGIFEVIVVGRGGRACTAAGLPHGWQYVRYVAVGPTGSAELDRDEVTPWAVDNARNRKTLFVGRRDQADPTQLPPDWR
jgi:hypothetical protein